MDKENKKNKIDRKKDLQWKISLIVAILIIIVFIFAVIFSKQNAYKKVLNNYVKSIQYQDDALMTSLFYNNLEQFAIIYGIDTEDDYKTLSQKYGEKLKIDYKILKKVKMSKEEIKSINEAFTKLIIFKKGEEIKKAYDLEVEFHYKGKKSKKIKDNKGFEKQSIQVYKIGVKELEDAQKLLDEAKLIFTTQNKE